MRISFNNNGFDPHRDSEDDVVEIYQSIMGYLSSNKDRIENMIDEEIYFQRINKSFIEIGIEYPTQFDHLSK